MVFELVTRGKCSNFGGKHSTGLLITLRKAGTAGHNDLRWLNIRVGEDVLKREKWVSGDYLQMMFDRESRMMGLQRVKKHHDAMMLNGKGYAKGACCCGMTLHLVNPEDLRQLLPRILPMMIPIEKLKRFSDCIAWEMMDNGNEPEEELIPDDV
jgi:hypothetical protein